MTTTWQIYDLAVAKAPENTAAEISSIFRDGFGLADDDDWRPDDIAATLTRISFLALAYATGQPSERSSPCGYAMYTVPSTRLRDGTYFLREDAICLRKSVQGGAARGLFAAMAERSRHQPIGWIGGRTQNPRVIRAYRKLGHTFPFAEDYSTVDGQALMTFLRQQVREVMDVDRANLDLAHGIARSIYRQGRLGDYPLDVEDAADIERQLAGWKFNRDRGDAVIVAARLYTPLVRPMG